MPDTWRQTKSLFLPTAKNTKLELSSAGMLAWHRTLVLPTAWKVRTVVELKKSPSAATVVLYRLLFTASSFRVQLTVGLGNQADVTHWNSTCWSCTAVMLPSRMVTVPLSEKYRQRQSRGCLMSTTCLMASWPSGQLSHRVTRAYSLACADANQTK